MSERPPRQRVRLRTCRAGASLLGLLAALSASAAEVRHFSAGSREDFLAGTLEGISVDPLGRLELAGRAERVAAVEEPFVFTVAPHPDGWVVGTGNAGRVLLIDRKGRVTPLFTAPEPEVFALRAESDGTVFAGTSPRGKVYRIRDGKGEVFFDPGETYIWGLERGADGALLVATGTDGKLFRVDRSGKGEMLFDTEDAHVRSLAALDGGDLLVGTADEGLVLRLSPDGTARTLFDSPRPEVVALAVGEGGEAWAAVVASEASLMETEAGKPAEAGSPQPAEGGEPQAVVTVTEEAGAPAEAAGRRPGKGPRSEVLRIAPGGLVETVWSFTEETVYGLLWHRGRLWVATGLEGKLYSFDGTAMVLEKDVDERQVVSLTADAPGPAFATTNAAALYRMVGGTENLGTYTSPALDAGQVARFGVLHWEGDQPAGSAIEFSFRSGLSAEPDRSWSPWTRPASGREVAVVGLPPGRYVQWRVELRAGGGGSPHLYGVELSYRQENLRPAIRSFSPMEAGQILVPAGFNPGNQVFEPAYPTREGIFTTLKPSEAFEDSRQKTLWKHGYRTLRWDATDPNGDDLSYALEFRPAASDGPWLPMVEDVTDSYLSFDATVLPDGVYRFRLAASDEPGDGSEALTASLVSEPVVIDHTPPILERVERAGGRLSVRVRDLTSPLREAVVSAGGAAWRPAVASDGLTDGRAETFEVTLPEGARLLLLRVTDAAWNLTTFDLTPELPP